MKFYVQLFIDQTKIDCFHLADYTSHVPITWAARICFSCEKEKDVRNLRFIFSRREMAFYAQALAAAFNYVAKCWQFIKVAVINM